NFHYEFSPQFETLKKFLTLLLSQPLTQNFPYNAEPNGTSERRRRPDSGHPTDNPSAQKGRSGAHEAGRGSGALCR
ncbi:unnamed protein product, partial [Oppiella nova]